MVRLRKGMIVTGQGNKRFVVTGWDSDSVFASLSGGNPDVDYYSWPKSWLTLDHRGMARVTSKARQRRERKPDPARVERARILQSWRHRAPAAL